MGKAARRRPAAPGQKLGPGGELIPKHGWTRRYPASAVAAGFLPAQASIWRTHDGLVAISALEMAKYPSGVGGGPQWHVSVVYAGDRRPTNADVARVVDAFGFETFDEDNHHPGHARHLWMPLDPAERLTCECKASERTVVEPDGYEWTTPADSTEGCRGCDFEAMMGRLGKTAPCPVHRPEEAR